MTLQLIIERLLRSRLYRTGVVVELDSGEMSQGFVKDMVYDGSRSIVVVADPKTSRSGRRIELARISRVESSNPDAA